MATDTRAAIGVPPRPVRERRVSTPRAVLVVAVLGTFMAFVDATIVNIAVPNIARDFGKPLSSVSWVLNAYNIVFAAFLVGGGQLADLLGRRRVFGMAIVLFTAASALCAVAPTIGLLIAARALQAIGAAALVPSSLAIVLEAHREGERTHAVALWSAVAALAAGIGPPLGGLLITASSWRLVFLVNIPVGLVALALTRRVIVESRAPGRRRVPDLLGALVLSAAIALLVLAIVKGQEWGWGSARTIAGFAAAFAFGAYFVLRSGRRRVPVVDLSLLRVRAFALSNAVTIVMASGFYAYTLCNVLFLTTVWRYSILTAGLALTPGPLTAMAVAGPASRLVERYGHRRVLVPGALIWAGGMAYFATRLGAGADFLGEWLPGMLILGVGAGMAFPTLSGAAVRSVPGPRFAIATSLNSVARQLGAALGVAVLVAILGTPSPLQALHAFERGWWFAAGCFLAGAIACLGLHVARTGDGTEAWAPPADGGAPGPTGATSIVAELPNLADSDELPLEVAPQSLADFLRAVALFADLEPALLDRVAALAEPVRLARGQWLFRGGEEPDAVYGVRLGHLEVVNEHGGPDGEELILNTLTRGAVLGELALLNSSRRSASVRALRDSELIRVPKPAFNRLLRSEPDLALALTAALSTQLQASRAILPTRKDTLPVTIAIRALDRSLPLLDLADGLSRELCAHGSVAVLYRTAGAPPESRLVDSVSGATDSEGSAHFAPLIERCERDHDRVLMVCDSGADTEWNRFCLSRADRVLALASAEDTPDDGSSVRHPELRAELERLWGCDLVLYRVRSDAVGRGGWVEAIAPRSIYSVAGGAGEPADLARVARRLAGAGVGVVLSGGGARAFAHLGALDVLLDAGLCVDRVGGVSMGAFIGGLLACGRDAAEIDAYCYEEWVRRNPINDYTVPRSSLIKGQKAEAMLERTFGDARIELLSRSFYCASVDLRAARLVIDRDGPLAEAVASSMALPLIGPPHRREGSLRIDGSLLDNLPLEPMAQAGEGPILAIDVRGSESPRQAGGGPASVRSGDGTAPADEVPRAPRRLPALPETMARIALLSSTNTGESARRYADLTIPCHVPGVGLLEFHQIDQAREVGRRAALAALKDAPEWLPIGDSGVRAGAPRRTVIRV
ncbi:MAG: DHA2 family efflux MFS transporter permease subunit [Solirubrobacterales bacterium]